MNLRTALRIKRGDVVAFVGGGGKTSALFRLAHELADARHKVITTTTTKIGRPTSDQTRCFIVEADRATLLAKTRQALETHQHVTVARESYHQGKFVGVPLEWIGELRALPGVYAVLSEADGARKLPFKAPRADEPIVPVETTVLVACAGIKAVGVALDETHICRSEIVAELSGAKLGEPLTIETMARVLAHPQGGMKHKPPQARAIALLNQADTPERIEAALALARNLHQRHVFDEALVTALAQRDPVLERWGRVSAVIQAAGEGRRFGSIKQLADWGGQAMIAHIVRAAEASQADDVQVVLGAHADEIRAHLSSLSAKTRIVLNPDWTQGMSSSLKLGLRELPAQTSAAFFMNVDQPGVTPHLLNRLIERYRQTGAPIVAPRFRNFRGNPVLWDHSLFAELQTLSGDMGGREILRIHQNEMASVEVDAEEELTDTDTLEEYLRLKELLGK